MRQRQQQQQQQQRLVSPRTLATIKLAVRVGVKWTRGNGGWRARVMAEKLAAFFLLYDTQRDETRARARTAQTNERIIGPKSNSGRRRRCRRLLNIQWLSAAARRNARPLSR